MIKKIFLLVSFFFTVFTINAQVCQNLDAGDDVNFDCENTSSPVDLTATVIVPNYKTTRDYTVGGELLCPPVTYDGSRTFIAIDDSWSAFVIDIPFTFCFYENQYDQILVSGNGIVTFDLTVIGQFSNWNTDPVDFLGTNGQQNWQTNAIFGAYHDMDSSVQPREDRISYKTVGVAPNRKFIISFDVLQFQCNDLLSKSQITLYESSNVIDVRVDEKPVCNTWNEGLAVVGIQNKSGTLSQTGREHGVWTPAAAGELWRFVPNGEDLAYTLTWYDEDGNILNSDDGGTTSNNEETITVNPSITSTYTVEMTLEEQCNDSTVIVTDSVTISTPFNLDINSPLDIEECETLANPGVFDFNIDQTTFILNGIDPALVAISYHPTLNDAQNNTAPITVLNPYNSASTTIYVRVEDLNDPTCILFLSFDLTVLPNEDTSFTYDSNMYCTNNANPLPNAVSSLASYTINNGGIIDSMTGEIDLVASGLGDDGTGVFLITHLINICTVASEFSITIELVQDASFDFPANVCFSDTTNPLPSNITTTGGVFSVNNGATIDVATGELDLTTTATGSTYEITYSFGGNCPSSTMQTVNVLADDDSSFTYPEIQYCNDAANPLPDSITTVGGDFTISNGGIIDTTTGEIDLLASGLGTDNTGVFVITYTTNGTCSTFTDYNITIELTNNASFDFITSVCIDEANPVATNIATAGGVFTVDNGATINATTGELDLSTTTAGTTYTIVYTFDGNCPSSTSQTVNVVAEDISTFDYPTNLFCNDGVNPIAGNIITAGGSFSIDNGGVIDATTGEINLSDSGLGTNSTGVFIVTYTTPDPCSTTSPFNITIELTNDASFDYVDNVCIDDVNPMATNIATAGGVFTVDNGAYIAADGTLDLSTTTAGTTYTIIYTFGGNCPSSTSQTVNVVAEDISTFDYSTNLFCNDDVNPIAGNIITAGGSFSIDNGGVIDATTGEINLSDSGLGTNNTGVFIVTYATPDPCSTTSPFNITIELTNDASFDYPSEICIADINPTATNIATAGGVFTVDNGASIATNGTLDLNTTVEGTTYTITYSFTGNCPSLLSQTILINESPTANLPDSIIHSCNNGDGTANFDINTTTIEDEIINGQTNVVVTYHISQANAESGSNAINFVPYAVLTGNDIWARIENGESCFDIVNISDNFVVDQCFLVFPTGFTPNNDGENELFTIEDASDRYIGELYPNFEIWIYNRYGNQVYTGKNGDKDWNGKIDNSGNDLPAGTYFFGLKLNDNQDISHRGWIYLQR